MQHLYIVSLTWCQENIPPRNKHHSREKKETKMSLTWVFVLSIAAMLVVGNGQSSVKPLVKTVKGKKVCDKGWECKGWSAYCCNETISDYFQTYQFENLFSKRNSPVAHAVGFWDYRSFITAAALYQPLGFGTTGGKTSGQKEVAAFLGHVGSKTSCGYGVDLLNHPEYIEQNATLAFQAAMWRWMTPAEKNLPSPHDVFVGNWKPTKNDTLSKRVPGFGATINLLYGDQTCGQGSDNEGMNNIISHYLYYLDLLGVGREEAGPNEILSCAEQEAFKPSGSPSSATN
ncbi:Chitinase-like protein 2, partial [Mucuna pruriens]